MVKMGFDKKSAVRQPHCDESGVEFFDFACHRKQCNRFEAAFGVIDKAGEAGFVVGVKNRQKTCRVSKRRCRHSLPSEPDVRLSPHPAQAESKPRRSGAGVTSGHLYDTRLQPPDLAFTLGPVTLVPVRCHARGRTHG